MRFSRQILLATALSIVLSSVVVAAAPVAYAAWTASATATATQSAAVVPAPTFATCVTTLSSDSAYLTWPAAPATVNGSAFSQYYIEWIYGTPANPGATILTATRTSAYANPTITGLTGVSFVRVTDQYANGWSSGTPTTYAFTVSTNKDKSPVCSPEKTS